MLALKRQPLFSLLLALSITYTTTTTTTDKNTASAATRLAFDVRSDPYFRMRWNVNNDTILIELRSSMDGWMSVGFSKQSTMINADMLIGYVDSHRAYIDDYWSSSFSEPMLDTSLGGRSDVVLLGGGRDNSGTWLKFERPLLATDPNDLSIHDEPLTVLFAGGASSRVSYHGAARDSISLNLITGEVYSATGTTTARLFSHGVVLSVVWVLLAVVAAFVVRYLKHYQWSLALHVVLSCIATLATVVMVIMVLADSRAPSTTHSVLGILSLVFVVVVTVLGAFGTRPLIGTLSETTIVRVNRYHRWLGWATLLFVFATCIAGWAAYSPLGVEAAWFYCSVAFVSVLFVYSDAILSTKFLWSQDFLTLENYSTPSTPGSRR